LYVISPIFHYDLAEPSRNLHHTGCISHNFTDGGNGMRVVWIFTGILTAAAVSCAVSVSAASAPAEAADASEAATRLVREVVYNEVHDHDMHGFWRYWVEHRTPKGTRVEEQVETSDGPITRALTTNGHPLDEQGRQADEARLRELMSSPSEQASHRQAYHEDEGRIGRILGLLPDAFLYEDAGEENGLRHLRFRPNPAYPPRSIEARIFHAMSGELWLDARMKRLARLNGTLTENVDFGFGILGRLYRGGWFQLERRRVSATDWKTERLEVHLSGRAMLFKTVARETSEVRGGFEPVPPRMSLEQGMRVLEDKDSAITAWQGKIAPAAMVLGK
jgi:hypothetical protein